MSNHTRAGIASQRVVRYHELASARGHDVQLPIAHQCFKTRKYRLFSYQVRTPRLVPQILELRIVDEHRRRSGRVSSVLKVVEAAVEQQRVAVSIKEDRCKNVIVTVHDHSTGRDPAQSR